MVRKTNLFALPKFWSPPSKQFGFFEDWQKFDNPQEIGKFLKPGVTLIFTKFVDSHCYFKINKICSSGTWKIPLSAKQTNPSRTKQNKKTTDPALK